MHRLIEGYRVFHQTYFEQHRGMFDRLAQGQAPKAMVISCCDSRVDPGLIFNAEPGEIFTLRNIANLVPPYAPDDHYHGTSAAIEFAVRSLAVEHIVVLGHARCGGIAALLGEHEGDFIGPWMRMAEPARRHVLSIAADRPPEVRQRLCEHETLKISLENLRSFPWIRERVQAGQLTLHAWYFDIEQGLLQALDQESGQLRSLL
jgi:carbonic anhydrase